MTTSSEKKDILTCSCASSVDLLLAKIARHSIAFVKLERKRDILII